MFIETKHIKILTIDDDSADRAILTRFLSKIGEWNTTVVECSTWGEAEKILDHSTVDLIILDYYLGGKNGVDILQTIRSQGNMTPVIVLTGQENLQNATAIAREGADDYIPKDDLTSDVLKYAIKGALERYTLREEKKVLADELQHAQKMETVGTLAGGIAHDFNNMLTGIMGFAELARNKFMSNKDPLGEIETIRAIGSQMAEIVQQLLVFGHRDHLDRSNVDLRSVIYQTVLMLQHTVPKTVEITTNFETDEKYVVYGNSSMLSQVLLNLGVNASDAMDGNGQITIDTSVKEIFVNDTQNVTSNRSKYICIRVTDSGMGIPENIKKRIFDPFFTTKERCSDKGTGLGLAVTWQNIKYHDGIISVESEEGKGSTFIIYLPYKEPAMEELPEKDENNELLKGTEQILVVDDEKFIRELAREILVDSGYSVLLAENGEEALELFEKCHHEISVVILDISMPKIDGRSCLKKMRSINRDIPILFASGYDVSAEENSLKQSGVQGIIQKPYSISVLTQKIRSVIEDRM